MNDFTKISGLQVSWKKTRLCLVVFRNHLSKALFKESKLSFKHLGVSIKRDLVYETVYCCWITSLARQVLGVAGTYYIPIHLSQWIMCYWKLLDSSLTSSVYRNKSLRMLNNSIGNLLTAMLGPFYCLGKGLPSKRLQRHCFKKQCNME